MQLSYKQFQWPINTRSNMCACGIGYVRQYHGSGAIHYLASSDTPTNFVEWGLVSCSLLLTVCRWSGNTELHCFLTTVSTNHLRSQLKRSGFQITFLGWVCWMIPQAHINYGHCFIPQEEPEKVRLWILADTIRTRGSYLPRAHKNGRLE